VPEGSGIVVRPPIRIRDSSIGPVLLVYFVLLVATLSAYPAKGSAAYRNGDVFAFAMIFSLAIGIPGSVILGRVIDIGRRGRRVRRR
jgi:hypothetical protein